MIYTESVSLE